MVLMEENKRKKMIGYQLKVKTLADLCRFASSFSTEYTPMIFSTRDKQGLTFFCPGMKVGQARILMTFESKEKGSPSFVSYKVGATSGSEEATLLDKLVTTVQDRNTAIMQVVELMAMPFTKTEKLENVNNIKVKDNDMLVRASINRAMEHSAIGRIYVFTYQGRRYAGSFSLLYMGDDPGDEDEAITFSYAELREQKEFQFFRYDYNSDKVEATNVFGEHSYLYARAINLAEAPSFFKPE